MVECKRPAPYIALQKSIQGAHKVFERFASLSESSIICHLEASLRSMVEVLHRFLSYISLFSKSTIYAYNITNSDIQLFPFLI